MFDLLAWLKPSQLKTTRNNSTNNNPNFNIDSGFASTLSQAKCGLCIQTTNCNFVEVCDAELLTIIKH